MLNQIKKTLINNRIFFISIFVFLIFTIAGIIGYSLLNKQLSSQGLEQEISDMWILVLLIVYGLIMLALIWFTANTTFKPTKEIIKAGQKIASQNMSLFSNAIVELSQGNLSKQLSFDAKSLAASKNSELNQVTDIFNSMIRNLKDAADAFNNITDIPCRRLFYVGADSFLEGRKCGELTGQTLNGKGQVVILAESLSASNLDLRRRGFISVLRDKYPNVEVLGAYSAPFYENMTYNVTMKVLKAHPHLSAIYVADGSGPQLCAKALADAKKAHQIKVICHDLADETMRWVRDGVITATLSQNTHTQGYDPIIHMFNHLAAGWEPLMPYLLTELEVVTKENYDIFWQEGKGIILSENAKSKLAEPLVHRSEKEIRIAVLGRDDNEFWNSIRNGVKAATETLMGHNVTIDWIIPPQAKSVANITAATYGPAIEDIIKKKYDGLVSVAPDREMIPYFNKAVEAGIPVGLYNSDPNSLRGLIFTITEQAQHLMGLSENLASNTSQTSQATEQIKNTMDDVAKGTKSQNNQVTRTGNALQSLLDTIDFVSKDAERSAEATEDTTKAVENGTDAMNKTLSTMQVIEKSVTNIGQIVEELGEHSERIDTVVDLIDDIASRVNVLALNAAIEATKAGEFGKGFMVVANEIRTLAKNTATATKEVGELIGTVQTDISKVEKVMSEGLEKVQHSSELTDNAMKALSEIQDMVEIDKQRIQNIARAMIDMQNSSHQVGEAMENVATASEKNMLAVEQVNTLTKDMTGQLNNVTDLAKSLEAMAKGEQQMLAKFSLLEDA